MFSAMFIKFFLARRVLSACLVTAAVGGGASVVPNDVLSRPVGPTAAAPAPDIATGAAIKERPSRDSTRVPAGGRGPRSVPDEPTPAPAPEAPAPSDPALTDPTGAEEVDAVAPGTGEDGASTAPSEVDSVFSPSAPAPAPAAASGSAVPTGDLPGWSLVLAEDFTRDAPLGQFDEVYPGWAGYDGANDTSGNGTYNSDTTTSVRGGILDKYLHTAAGSAQVAALTPAVDGRRLQGQLNGRYSVHFRADNVPGYKMAWLLWSSSDDWSQGEIDFPEARLGDSIKGYAHEVDGDPSNNAWWVDTGVSMTDWHTATIEWTPDRITFLLDGQSWSTSDRSAIPTDPMRWVLQTETRLSGGGPDAAASGHVQIDWVAAWARA